MTQATQKITLGGGCFWCIESAFNTVKGISKATSGYMGGAVAHPTYEQICSGKSGHAEVVQVDFDPSIITVREILEIFFSLHNPTQLNRQGHDVGSQYRSAVFYHNSEQQQQSNDIIEEMTKDNTWPDPIVTEVTASSTFYCAEHYHQDYANKNPDSRYCQLVISPKLAKFKQTFANKLK